MALKVLIRFKVPVLFGALARDVLQNDLLAQMDKKMAPFTIHVVNNQW